MNLSSLFSTDSSEAAAALELQNEQDDLDDEGDIIMAVVIATVCMMEEEEADTEIRATRQRRQIYTRIDWDTYFQQNIHTPDFERRICMSHQSFSRLLSLIE